MPESSPAETEQDPDLLGDEPTSPGKAGKILRSLFGLTLVFLPAILLFVMVRLYAVDVPMWDDWERAKYVEKQAAGELSWSDLWAPHIDHRTVVQRGIMLLNVRYGGGDLRNEITVVALLSLLMALGAFILLRRTLGKGSPLLYPAGFLLNTILLSALLWQNYLWAVQIAFVLPACCAVWVLVVLGWKRFRAIPKFFLCLLLALVATGGFGHGLLLWPLVLFALLLGYGALPWKTRGFFALAWVLVAAFVVHAYFDPDTFKNSSHPSHSYGQGIGEAPPGLSRLDEARENQEKITRFFGASLGSPFARLPGVQEPLSVAVIAGWIQLGGLALLGIVWLLRIRTSALWEDWLPWFALAGFSIAGALMLALSRVVGIGVLISIAPRYIGITFFVSAALLVLLLAAGQDFFRRRGSGARRFGRDIFCLLAGLFVACQALFWVHGFREAKVHHEARIRGSANLAFIEEFTPELMHRLDLSYPFVKQSARTLADNDALGARLVEGRGLAQFEESKSELSGSRASFQLSQTGPGTWQAEGFAELPGGRPAGIVLLVADNAEGEAEVFALGEISNSPTGPGELLEVERQFAPSRKAEATGEEIKRPDIRWSASFEKKDLPGAATDLRLEAWVLDVEKWRVARIKEAYELGEDDAATEASE